MLTPATCRAARGILSWSQLRLADVAKVGISSLKHYESNNRKLVPRKVRAIRRAFEAEGIEFILQDGYEGLVFKPVDKNETSSDAPT